MLKRNLAVRMYHHKNFNVCVREPKYGQRVVFLTQATLTELIRKYVIIHLGTHSTNLFPQIEPVLDYPTPLSSNLPLPAVSN